MVDQMGRITVVDLGFEQVKVFPKDTAFSNIVHICQGQGDIVAIMVKDVDAMVEALLKAKQTIIEA